MIGLALLRCVTSWWPRSSAERLAEVFVSVDAGRDAVLESSFSALGDDSFDLAEAGVDLGDPVLMFPGAVVDDDAVKCASADSAAGVGPTAVPLDPPSGQPALRCEWCGCDLKPNGPLRDLIARAIGGDLTEAAEYLRLYAQTLIPTSAQFHQVNALIEFLTIAARPRSRP